VLTEGFDEPSIDCIIVARPTESKPLYIQMVGRGTRVYPGKQDLLILDLVGVTSRHSIITANEIFKLGLTKKSVKEKASEREARARAREEEAAALVDGKLVARDVELFRARPMNWIQTRAGTWVLGLGNGFVRLASAEGDRWDVHYMQNGGQAMLLRAGLPLGYAQGVAEDFARQQGAGGLLNPKARWREEPATDKQIKWLKWKG
jgi:hypothetical protein